MKVEKLRRILDECMDDSDVCTILDGEFADLEIDRFETQNGSLILFPKRDDQLHKKILNQVLNSK